MGKQVFSRILFLCTVFSFLVLGACEKKERLGAATFQFAIDPPAQAVLKGQTFTFNIVSSLAGEPTWAVSVSSVGTINTSIGPTIVFSAVDLGDTKIFATLGGATTVSEVAVVAYIPGASEKFDIYTDDGIPLATNDDPDIFVSPANTPASIQISEQTNGSEYAPEGVKLMRTLAGTVGIPSWGVTFDINGHGHSRDLTAFYDGGKRLKFYIRLHRALVGAEAISARVESIPSSQSLALIAGAYMSNNTNWQEVSIPLANFVVDKTQIKVPFAVVLNNIASPLTFDVDAVRWE